DSMPKQFLALGSERTFYQDTLMRLPPKSAGGTDPIVITADAFRFFARRQAAEIGMDATIILEPARRDSAAALIVAARYAQKLYGDDCLVLALAADHLVPDIKLFQDACLAGAAAAEEGHIVTFGIT